MIKAQITASLLIGTIGIIVGLGGTNKTKYSIIVVLFLLLIFVLIPTSYISDIIATSAELFDSETILHNRLIDLKNTIDQGIMMGNTHISHRADRIPFLLEQFSKSPIIGGGESTGHVFWLDRLSMYGLVGIMPWILILMHWIKLNFKILSNDYKFYYLVSMLLFIGLGFMKSMGGRRMMLIVFFLIPGINYLKYLLKNELKT